MSLEDFAAQWARHSQHYQRLSDLIDPQQRGWFLCCQDVAQGRAPPSPLPGIDQILDYFRIERLRPYPEFRSEEVAQHTARIAGLHLACARLAAQRQQWTSG